MTVLLEQLEAVDVDERAARADLRAQIARLERRGGAKSAERGRGPTLLSLGELEATRDALATSSGGSGSNPEHNGSLDDARGRLERMIADPAAHRGWSVSLAELGQPGCGSYRVKPRYGLIGMLAGWWEMTLSSGCP